MIDENNSDKRRYQRVSTKGLTVYIAETGFFSEWHKITSQDFTREGLGFVSYKDESEEDFFRIGQNVLIYLKVSHTQLTQKHEAKIHARIANKRFIKNKNDEQSYYRYGVQFLLGEGKKRQKNIALLGPIEGVLARINTYL